mmetsp:Transcript_27317/g.55821  ORF Transcript_27317/g.55821 Transcript_27317/m.55821 type:complete len:252 (-) Transcript_27317:1143-1898(-)
MPLHVAASDASAFTPCCTCTESRAAAATSGGGKAAGASVGEEWAPATAAASSMTSSSSSSSLSGASTAAGSTEEAEEGAAGQSLASAGVVVVLAWRKNDSPLQEPLQERSGRRPARRRTLLTVFLEGMPGNMPSMRRRNSWARAGSTWNCCHPRKESSGSAEYCPNRMPSAAAIWSWRRRHSCWLLMCRRLHMLIWLRNCSVCSHGRRLIQLLRSSCTFRAQCFCPSRAFCCISGRPRTCAPRLGVSIDPS